MFYITVTINLRNLENYTAHPADEIPKETRLRIFKRKCNANLVSTFCLLYEGRGCQLTGLIMYQ